MKMNHMYNEISQICVANQCTSLDQLSSKRCPRIAGKECAGKGVGFPQIALFIAVFVYLFACLLSPDFWLGVIRTKGIILFSYWAKITDVAPVLAAAAFYGDRLTETVSSFFSNPNFSFFKITPEGIKHSCVPSSAWGVWGLLWSSSEGMIEGFFEVGKFGKYFVGGLI